MLSVIGDVILDNVKAGVDPINPENTDSTDERDYLDLDSDNDGIPDSEDPSPYNDCIPTVSDGE